MVTRWWLGSDQWVVQQVPDYEVPAAFWRGFSGRCLLAAHPNSILTYYRVTKLVYLRRVPAVASVLRSPYSVNLRGHNSRWTLAVQGTSSGKQITYLFYNTSRGHNSRWTRALQGTSSGGHQGTNRGRLTKFSGKHTTNMYASQSYLRSPYSIRTQDWEK